jgi:hypothetical protein
LRGGRIRAALITAEVALGTVLVIGSGLLLMSFYQVMNTHRGFDGHDVLIVDLPLPSPKYRADGRHFIYSHRLRSRSVEAYTGALDGKSRKLPIDTTSFVEYASPSAKKRLDI